MGAVITNKDGLLRKDNPLNQGLKLYKGIARGFENYLLRKDNPLNQGLKHFVDMMGMFIT